MTNFRFINQPRILNNIFLDGGAALKSGIQGQVPTPKFKKRGIIGRLNIKQRPVSSNVIIQGSTGETHNDENDGSLVNPTAAAHITRASVTPKNLA